MLCVVVYVCGMTSFNSKCILYIYFNIHMRYVLYGGMVKGYYDEKVQRNTIYMYAVGM